MIVSHNDLKEEARGMLHEMGFTDNQIFEEYNVISDKTPNRSFFIVDIAGISKDRRVAIECGALHCSLKDLQNYFDKVIILPYVKKVGSHFHCGACGHKWSPRVKIPKSCPRCKMYFFLKR